MKKIIKYNELEKIIPQLTGKKVLVGGCFDLLHLGHIKFLKAAKKEGDILIIALESDKFIRKKKKREPFHSQQQRAEILVSLKSVDLVILLPYFCPRNKKSLFKNYLSLVKKISPKIIAVTENDPLLEDKRKQASICGAQIKVFPFISGFSSTDLIKKLKKILT